MPCCVWDYAQDWRKATILSMRPCSIVIIRPAPGKLYSIFALKVFYFVKETKSCSKFVHSKIIETMMERSEVKISLEIQR